MKEQGKRVDFRPDDFTLAIETKGYRLAWSRAAYCPCAPVNDQTEQSDPNCPICEGSGWLMFAPVRPVTTIETGELDSLQTKLVGTDSGVIFGIMSGITAKEMPYDQVQKRLEGQQNLTVRPENRLGYHDRLIHLDTTVVYAQVAEADGTATLKQSSPTNRKGIRYPIVCMNLFRTLTQVFVEGTDFNIIDGEVTFLGVPPPDKGTFFAMHYLTFPHWRVIEHPHVTRATLLKFKKTRLLTPRGDPVDLPVEAVCKLEFLLT